MLRQSNETDSPSPRTSVGYKSTEHMEKPPAADPGPASTTPHGTPTKGSSSITSLSSDSPVASSPAATSPSQLASPVSVSPSSSSSSPTTGSSPGWSARALSALGMLGVYGRGTTVVPPASLVSDYDLTYPHKLFGIFRNTDTTKLTPEEEITLKVVVPGGKYLIQARPCAPRQFVSCSSSRAARCRWRTTTCSRGQR